jgi:hypothetical protein
MVRLTPHRVGAPSRFWRTTAARVGEIGGQTGQEMDDLGAIADRGGYVFIQVKLRLRLGLASEVIRSNMVH